MVEIIHLHKTASENILHDGSEDTSICTGCLVLIQSCAESSKFAAAVGVSPIAPPQGFCVMISLGYTGPVHLSPLSKLNGTFLQVLISAYPMGEYVNLRPTAGLPFDESHPTLSDGFRTVSRLTDISLLPPR